MPYPSVELLMQLRDDEESMSSYEVDETDPEPEPDPLGIPGLYGTAGDEEISLDWDSVSDASSYDLEIEGSHSNMGNTTSHTETGLTNGDNYDFRVRARNDTQVGDWSDTLTIAPVAPADPGDLTLPAPNIMMYDFESGDFEESVGDGFFWYDNVAFSVVKDDNTVTGNSGGLFDEPKGPFPGKDWENNPITAGQHAARARYAAERPQTEIRFNLGNDVLDDIWYRWWLKVPINFYHPPNKGENNKLFIFWMDDYSSKGQGSSCGMEFRPDNSDSGGSRFYCKISPGGGNVLGGDQGSTPFISYPADQGRWMCLAVHLVCSSSNGADDGVMEVYRAWENEDSFTRTHYLTGQPINKPSSPQGFHKGYLMGYANAPYNEDTEWLLDDFCVSTNSLV